MTDTAQYQNWSSKWLSYMITQNKRILRAPGYYDTATIDKANKDLHDLQLEKAKREKMTDNPKPMTLREQRDQKGINPTEFRTLKRRDYENGAVLNELYITVTVCDKALDQLDEMAAAGDRLQRAESRYRKSHDIHGATAMSTGQALDAMRRAGDELRAVLARYKGCDE